MKGDHLETNKRFFHSEMERGVMHIRETFRQRHGINPGAYVIFLAPGNEVNEVEFTMENLRKGVKEFLLKYSYPTSLSAKAMPLDGHFVTVLSTHAGSPAETWVKDYLHKHEWTGRLVQVHNDENEHLNAMCASDFGFIHDGQMVSSANALNLPVNTMFHMRMHQQFYHNYFNRWWNDMNLICDRDVNPELIGGQAWFGKMADTLAEDFINPNSRHQRIK